jgi:hypothetical protein
MSRSQADLSRIDNNARTQLGSTQEHLRSQETLGVKSNLEVTVGPGGKKMSTVTTPGDAHEQF